MTTAPSTDELHRHAGRVPRMAWLGALALFLLVCSAALIWRADQIDDGTERRYQQALNFAFVALHAQRLSAELREQRQQLRAQAEREPFDPATCAQNWQLLRRQADAFAASLQPFAEGDHPLWPADDDALGTARSAISALQAALQAVAARELEARETARPLMRALDRSALANADAALLALAGAAHRRADAIVAAAGSQGSGSQRTSQPTLIAIAALTMLIGTLLALASWRAVAANQRLVGQLNQLAHEDGLTGVTNRRRLDEQLPIEVARATRTGQALTVVMIDLDHFKRYNDRRGHGAGDALLRGAAQAWRKQLRPTDMLARYGGEEFTLVLPACDADQAAQLIDRLRPLVPDGQTFSAGIARNDTSEVAADLVARADRALMRAKKLGRNRSVIAGREPQLALPLRSA